MTTIAYCNGVIAYDSRITQGSTIADDEYDKHIVKNGVHYFLCGGVANHEILINAHQKGPPDEIADGISAGALIYKNGLLYTAAITTEEGYWCCPERMDGTIALGSGSDHALTAMDLGLSAKEAVMLAAKRDVNTGGKIRTFRL